MLAPQQQLQHFNAQCKSIVCEASRKHVSQSDVTNETKVFIKYNTNN